jgi:ABC-type sugar transport system, permease component
MPAMDRNRGAEYGVIRGLDFGRPSVKAAYALIYTVCALILLLGVAPMVWVILSGFKTIKEFVMSPNVIPVSFDLAKYEGTWTSLKFARYYVNSLWSVLGSVVCAVLFNGLLGYALSKIRPAGWKLVYGLVMAALLIPATTSIVPLFMNITRLHLNGGFLPLWLSIGANAFYVVLFKSFFDSLPNSLIEAAKIDGCSELRVFRSIALPLSRAIVMVVAIYAINAAWSDFLLPYLVLNQSGLETAMVRLFQFRNGKTSDVDILRAIVFVIIPPIILFLAFQKQITQVTVQSGIKG